MIEKIKIASREDRTGVSKNGRGYTMVILETEDGRRLSLYADKEMDLKFRKLDKVKDWKEGDEVTVDITPTEDGKYLNFDLPSKTDILSERVFELEGRLGKIEELLKNAKKTSNN